MAGTQAAQTLFITSARFAVVGASKDESKFGTKVLRWYLDRNKPVTPIHPKENELQGITTLPSLADLPSPKTTSVSVITPPKVTLGLLEEFIKLDMKAAWIQPGAADEVVGKFIVDNGLEERVVWGGPCILVLGDGLLKQNSSSL